MVTLAEGFKQCVNSVVFKHANDQCPNYLNKVFEIAPENNIQIRGNSQKFNCPFRKLNAGPTIWSKPIETLKRAKIFRHVYTSCKKTFKRT